MSVLSEMIKKKSILLSMLLLMIIVIMGVSCKEGMVGDNDYPMRPMPFNEVTLIDDFWLPKFSISRLTRIYLSNIFLS
mgnify:FL=1